MFPTVRETTTPLPLQPWRPVYGRQCLLLFFNFPSFPPSFFLPPSFSSFLPSLPSFTFFCRKHQPNPFPPVRNHPLAFQLLPRTIWQLDILQENQRWESKETEHLLPKEEASSQVREIDSSHQKHTPVVHVFFICFWKTIFIIDP